MYKLFLCLRYLHKARIVFFSVIAVCLCTAMVLIVYSVLSGFVQMVRDHSRGMLGDLIMENNSLQGWPYYAEFIDQIKHDPETAPLIHEATPVIIVYGIIRFPTDQITKPAQIVGINLAETSRVNDFAKGLFYEKYYPGTTTFEPQAEPRYGFDENGRFVLPPKYEQAYRRWTASTPAEEVKEAWRSPYNKHAGPGLYLPRSTDLDELAQGPAMVGRELPGAIIGTDMLAERNSKGDYERVYQRGYMVTLTFVPFTEGGRPARTGSGMASQACRYVDDCRTGVFDIDQMSVYVDFKLLQELVDMSEVTPDVGETIPARTTQVQIRLTEGTDPIAARGLLQAKWDKFFATKLATSRVPALLQRVRILTWEEKQAKYIGAVEKEKYLVTTMFGVVSLVAILLVASIFYMIVQQKTRDIGIIKSVGATSGGVAQIFLAYGAAVGVVGGGLGTVIGTLFVWYINEFQAFLAWISPNLVVYNPEVYAFDRIPNHVSLGHAATIYVMGIVVSVLGATLAAIKAARVWPVEALRYE